MSPALAETLAATGLVTLAVLLVRRPVGQAFGARAAYALWLAPLARMAWPLLPAWPSAAPAAGANEPTLIAITLEPAGRALSALPAWLLPLWLGGAALYLGSRLAAHHRFLTQALREGRPLLERASVDLIATPAVDGPLATGLVHPLILVPADFDTRFTPEQQHLALAHEELHHRRGDLWACSAALFLTALNWFNPLAHLALAAFRRDMERACDAQLIAEGRAERADYAETLLRCAARPVPRSLCALTSIDELKGRLTMLANTPSTLRRLAGTAFAAIIAGAGLTVALPAAAQDKQEVKKEIRIVDVVGGPELTPEKRAQIEAMAAQHKCPDGSEAISAETPEAKGADGKVEKSRIMLCTKGGTKAEAIAGLEKALARVKADTDMNAAIKAEVTAKLQARIAEMKAN